MGHPTQLVAPGRPALAALRTAIDELQAGNRLAPVTVVVPGNSVGVAARRWLAANGGVAAVQFVTIHHLAEQLGAAPLVAAGRRPVSTAVVDVAVRHALARRPGVLAPIARHRATVTAVRRLHRELRHVPSAALARIEAEGSRRAADLVALHRLVTAELAPAWYDEADVLASAAAGNLAAPVVVHLPERLTPTAQALLDALASRQEVRTIVGADGWHVPGAVELVDTSDADEEVREAVRRIVAAAADGVALADVAVVWPVADPYARLLAEHLDAAGIPWNGRPGIAAHERLAGRIVLDVLDIDRRGLRRVDLFDALAHLPRDRRASVGPWERVARRAGLAGGQDWDTQLVHFERERRATGHRAEADDAAELRAFVDDLRGRLGPPGERATWRRWAEVAGDVLDTWLGATELPPAEQAAHAQVVDALDALGRLDEVDDPVDRGVFTDALAAELEATPARAGRIGHGVQVGPLSFATGQALRHVYVVGAIEGQLPAVPRPDPLLGDADRALAGGALALSANAIVDQHRQFVAAVAAAEHAVILRPRGDLRTTADRQPSRWIAELAAATPLTEHSVSSFAGGLADAAFPATAVQHRVRALVHHARRGEPIDTHPLAADLTALRRGLATIRARAADRLTEFDGDLGGLPIPSPLDAPISPTALELWATCPYAYFVHHVLGVSPVEQPAATLQIRPVDQGTLVHEVLDHFHRRVLDGRLPQPGVDGWQAEHLTALEEELTAAATRMEAAGRVGRPAMWAAGEARLRTQLRRWLAADGARLAEREATIVASELRFGRAGANAAPVEIALPGGRVARLTGAVDRIDRGGDGTLYVVDHKTGSNRAFTGITDDDPTAGGRRLQLPVYAAAARQLFAEPGEQPEVRAEYSFLRGLRPIGTAFPPGPWPGVGEILAAIVDGIAAGLFFALPPRSQHRLPWVECEYCDPDHLGTAERYEEHERKRADPRLAALLADPDDGSDEPADGQGDDRG